MIAAKHEEDPLREDFEEWVRQGNIEGRKPTFLHLLMTRFREMKGSVDFERIEKEFRYTKEYMELIKERGKVMAEEFSNSKEEQEENIESSLLRAQAVMSCFLLMAQLLTILDQLGQGL